MTQDEIIELAKQAGFERLGHTDKDWVCYPEDIEHFAELVRDTEREACAKVCETLWDTSTNGMATEEQSYGDECALAIRARGQPKRAWVGLTYEDMQEPKTHIFDFINGARWAEAKLKERNT